MAATVGSAVAEVILRFVARTKQAIKDMQKFEKQATQTLDKVEKKQADMQKKPGFQMWALSFMFAGMIIMRMADQLARSSVAAFMKITGGVTESGKAISRLAIHWEFLKFSIGDAIGNALLPMLPAILDIIDNIANWVQENQTLTAQIILATFAIGLLMMTLGQLAMLFSAVREIIFLTTGRLITFGTAAKGVGPAAKAGTAAAGLAFWELLIIAATVAAMLVIVWDDWSRSAQHSSKAWLAASEGDFKTFREEWAITRWSFLLGWAKIMPTFVTYFLLAANEIFNIFKTLVDFVAMAIADLFGTEFIPSASPYEKNVMNIIKGHEDAMKRIDASAATGAARDIGLVGSFENFDQVEEGLLNLRDSQKMMSVATDTAKEAQDRYNRIIGDSIVQIDALDTGVGGIMDVNTDWMAQTTTEVIPTIEEETEMNWKLVDSLKAVAEWKSAAESSSQWSINSGANQPRNEGSII